MIASLKEHLPILGKVAMALIGDGSRIESILEEVARQAGQSGSVPTSTWGPSDPPRIAAKAWLIGLVRVACAKAVTKLPIKTRSFETATTPEAASRAQLAALRPTEREAVILSIIGRLSAEELATACNVDVATAKERLSRGLQQMMTAEGSTK